MITIIRIFFYISVFIIFWGMIGYPISIRFFYMFFKNKKEMKTEYLPTVTLMIVAHNEEKVILEKLENAISLDYPNELYEILVTSDNSTDKTNDIVLKFIEENPNYKIRFYNVRKRKGKTNAQNEAQKYVNSEILVMTDANSIFNNNAIRELVSSFSSPNIGYVCGQLVYVNDYNSTAYLENKYWKNELKTRAIESKMKTITNGNGAIYAVRNDMYVDLDLINAHDSSMPRYMALNGFRAIYNPKAVAKEKAGENINDEYKRKVRMNRNIIKSILPSIKILNIFKYGWYTYFYLGHKTARYLLWIMHLILLVSSAILSYLNLFYFIIFIGQVIFYIIALITHVFKIKFKLFKIIYYYTITIIAQWHGVYNIVTRKAKPFWDKAESTR